MSLDFMKDDGVFLPMLNDIGRNNFYKSALDAAAPGKVVCDIGAGTGLLSILAANSGAKHVIAVERNSDRCQYLQQILDRIGYSDRIEVVEGDFLNLGVTADVYVSETINTQIFGEDMIKLSNHASQHHGRFIPQGFRIWAEIYQDHPVFILDLMKSEAYDFNPHIDVGSDFVNAINQDFADQYNLSETVFTANQLNRLFTMLDKFTDLKLNQLHRGAPVDVKLDNFNDESNIEISVPGGYEQTVMLVIKWQAYYENVTLDSDQCWFGNIAKPIHPCFTSDPNIRLRYDPEIKNWRLRY